MDWLTAAVSFAASLLATGVSVGLVLGRLRAVEVEGERVSRRVESLEGTASKLERTTALIENSLDHLSRGQDSYRSDLVGLESRLLARLDEHHASLRRELDAAGVMRKHHS